MLKYTIIIVSSLINKLQNTLEMTDIMPDLLQLITDKFKPCNFIEGIVLGGSRATNTASNNSDYDIGIYYNKKWLGKFTKSASQIPVINAEIVTAISLALIFSFIAMGRSYGALLIGHIVLCTPFVVLSVLPKLKQLDPSLYEAALDLGATPAQALFKVVIPEILPGIFSGFMLAITLSLDDYMVTAYTKPPTMETISTYVYGAMRRPSHSYLAELRALASIIFIVMMAAVLIINVKASSKIKKEKNKNI